MKIATWKFIVPILLAFEICLFLLTQYIFAVHLIFCGLSLSVGLGLYLGKKRDLGQALILTAVSLPVLTLATFVLFIAIIAPFKS